MTSVYKRRLNFSEEMGQRTHVKEGRRRNPRHREQAEKARDIWGYLWEERVGCR